MNSSTHRLAYDPDNPIGLMLSGGGARGAFQVGVWKVLLEDRRGLARPPSVISGTSAGALNGALIAAGLSPDEILDFWLRLADKPPVRANEVFFRSLERALTQLARKEPFRGFRRRAREVRTAARMLSKHKWYKSSGMLAAVLEFLLTARFDNVSVLLDSIQTSYLFDTTPLREVLRDTIGGDYIPPGGPVKLAINTVDIGGGGVVRIVNHKPRKARRASVKHYQYEPRISLDMIIASASIPLLFNPVMVRGRELWDGGLLVNSPMAPAVALGATRLIPVLVTSENVTAGARLQNFGSAVERLADTFLENAYNIDRKLLLNSNAIARSASESEYREVTLFKAIRPASSKLFNAGSYLFFERSVLLSMYHAGQIAAKKWLARGPELDGRNQDQPRVSDAQRA